MEIGKRKQEPTVQVAVPVSKLTPAVRKMFGIKGSPFGQPPKPKPKPYTTKLTIDPRYINKTSPLDEIRKYFDVPKRRYRR